MPIPKRRICCIFWPANGCSAPHLLVEITVFPLFVKKEGKITKYNKKHLKRGTHLLVEIYNKGVLFWQKVYFNLSSLTEQNKTMKAFAKWSATVISQKVNIALSKNFFEQNLQNFGTQKCSLLQCKHVFFFFWI